MPNQTWRNLGMAIALSVAGAGLVSAQPGPEVMATIKFWAGDKHYRPDALTGDGTRDLQLKTLTGGYVMLSHRYEATVLDLKKALSVPLLVPVENIKLYHGRTNLEDDAVVIKVNKDGDALHLVVRLIGG